MVSHPTPARHQIRGLWDPVSPSVLREVLPGWVLYLITEVCPSATWQISTNWKIIRVVMNCNVRKDSSI